jgi:hypothetical protein
MLRCVATADIPNPAAQEYALREMAYIDDNHEKKPFISTESIIVFVAINVVSYFGQAFADAKLHFERWAADAFGLATAAVCVVAYLLIRAFMTFRK